MKILWLHIGSKRAVQVRRGVEAVDTFINQVVADVGPDFDINPQHYDVDRVHIVLVKKKGVK